MARINYKLSEKTRDNRLKKQLIENGFHYVEQALKSGKHNYSVHKWYAILLNAKSQFNSSEEQIQNTFEIKKHFQEAIRLNPTDAMSYYFLGIWHYEVAHLSTWKQRITKLIYGESPQSTIREALKYFILAEEIDPGFYNKNMLMLVKCYYELNAKPLAMEFAKIILEKECKTNEDQEIYNEVIQLIPKIKKLKTFKGQMG
ncbi:unnamed protein product [Didymodactylos carnosus]|uniref:Regulator of microtubule dynamics protein 1 n=1 Tax=Didymodactylos carnosus TaxID=1234261 RepID=A0A813NQ56_9BILA|nr:unnamed protein product [Didymodactylos carnosus]CAF0915458.1 unnamed protein product [Didymodactylos carnosus]CAF3517072.1 unnamed protein product [Didymodactylos carnosus]CAF3693803.1 unnamed protein product [Didymodactylos carnosus]